AGRWEVTLQVADSFGGKDHVRHTINVIHSYQAAVRHTSAWQKRRRKADLNQDRFLPGEAFLLTATADSHATGVNVLSPFKIGKPVVRLKQKAGKWQAVLDNPNFIHLKEGAYTFTFVFRFDDGQTRKVKKTIKIGGYLDLQIHLTQ
ncbi:MAG TPA: hypothetical protein VF199_03835, partial [Bacillales bacterium]